ncbi:putative F-box/LRR-repeat protein At3g59230 [Solanum stenotomum]|uniref:putative F-box/LRR-repeat protein At3g59230 n=1 Tax=Solanum stenotomum TaxID=172797 RepID=UPI0020D07D3F|nr:putative F-box/LRR-repeat protein At3g59230 [Solanum stenotomum]
MAPRNQNEARNMAKRVCVDGEDRISELPVHIIHHILCRTDLDVEEAAISCMLSKRWYYCWTSRPNLIFDQFQGYKYRPLENYVKLVDQSLRFHVEQNLHLEQFILRYRDLEVDSHVDTWIELAVKLNVTELGIRRFGLTSYNLPDVIYDAKKLTTLQLSRCPITKSYRHMPIYQDSKVTVLSGYKQMSYFWPSTSQVFRC